MRRQSRINIYALRGPALWLLIAVTLLMVASPVFGQQEVVGNKFGVSDKLPEALVSAFNFGRNIQK